MNFKKSGFTLAEMLITLAVIGIVAALTIPGLVKNHNEKAWSTAKDLIEKKLVETTRRMNIDGVMTGYSTTESFMNEFKKYMKVIKVCNNSEINKCYSPKVVTTGKKGDEVEVTTADLKTASNLGITHRPNTNTMAYVIADGTTVIMSYNPDCAYVDPYSKEGQAGQVGCMAMMIDVNGKKGPNRVGKDIKLSEGVAFSTCDNPIGDLCLSTEFAANTAINTCDGSEFLEWDTTGSSNSYCANNYWAKAKQTCSEKGMTLPTRAQLAQLANAIYTKDGSPLNISYNQNATGLVVKPEYANSLTFGYYYWSSEQPSGDVISVYRRCFNSTSTDGDDNYSSTKRSNSLRAVCFGS